MEDKGALQDLEKAASSHKANTGVGTCDVHLKVPQDLSTEMWRKSADPSVIVWEQLDCFFFVGREGRRRARALDRRRQAEARPGRRRQTPSKEETVELISRANEGVLGSGVIEACSWARSGRMRLLGRTNKVLRMEVVPG